MLTKKRSSYQRLLRIHAEIQAKRFPNVTNLARSLEWCEKTIRRDLEYLRDSLGAPLAYDAHRRGFYYTRSDFHLPSITINEGELLGVFLGGQLLRQYHGTELGGHLTRLYAKLVDFLPNTVLVKFDDFQGAYYARQAPSEPVEPSLMQSLLNAATDRCRLEIVYYSASRDFTQQRQIDPYGFHFVDGDCYVIAYCHLREEVRIFHPARIRELKRTHETFERPADFDLAHYLDEGFRQFRSNDPAQQVTLRFSANIMRHVQYRIYHPTQKTEPQSDGSLLLHFTVNHTLEAKRLALSFGPDCEVLAPASLREEYVADLRRMVAKFLEHDQTPNKDATDGER